MRRSLARELRPYGFSPRYMERSYRRVTPYGFDAFGLSFVRTVRPVLIAHVHAAVRHDRVEDLCNRRALDLDAAQRRATCTVGGDLGELFTPGDLRLWVIEREVDLVDALLGITHAFRNLALPYFDRFASLEEVLRICREDRVDRWRQSPEIHSPSPLRRAKTAIAAAFVLQDRAAFDDLVVRKARLLRRVLGRYDRSLLDRFNRLAVELDRDWPRSAP